MVKTLDTKSSSGVATELVVRVYPAVSRRIVMCLLAIDLTFVALYLLPNLLGHSPRMFDLDAELNLPTWYASAKLLLLAQALMALALLVARRSRLDATPFLFLAVVALLLSADEVATIHERFARHFETGLTGAARAELFFAKTGYWMLALGPLLTAALGVGIWLITNRLAIPRSAACKGLLGVAVFFLSATGLEMLSNFTTGMANVVQVTAEEGGEMIGVSLILWSLLDLLAAKLEPSRQHAPHMIVGRQNAASAYG